MIVFGDVASDIIWRAFIETYGPSGITAIAIADGKSISYSRRLPGLMRAFWERTQLVQQRAGYRYFPEMLRRLVLKPDDDSTNVPGDFSEMENQAIVGGEKCLSLILEDNPEFFAILPTPRTGSSVSLTDVYDGFNYMIGFPESATIAKFLFLSGDTWTVYLGTSDTQFSPRCTQVIYDDIDPDA